MLNCANTSQTFAMPARVAAGDSVTYLGHAAEVRHVFTTTANIVMTPPVRGLSRQLDVYLATLTLEV